MVDSWIHGTTDPFPVDIGDYIRPIAALSLQAESAAIWDQLFLYDLSQIFKQLFQISHHSEFSCS